MMPQDRCIPVKNERTARSTVVASRATTLATPEVPLEVTSSRPRSAYDAFRGRSSPSMVRYRRRKALRRSCGSGIES